MISFMLRCGLFDGLIPFIAETHMPAQEFTPEETKKATLPSFRKRLFRTSEVKTDSIKKRDCRGEAIPFPMIIPDERTRKSKGAFLVLT